MPQVAPQAGPLMPGADPFDLPGGAVGVLLCHGFTSTPQSLRLWGEHLAAAGFTVRCPLLPGHGTRWQDANASTEEDWYQELSAALDDLRARCGWVVVAGLSMGGALALRLAQRRPDDVAALVLVNPSLLTERRDARLLPLLARLTPAWAPVAGDIKKPGSVELAYPRLPTRAALGLRRLWTAVRADLGAVRAPLLVFRSVTDHVVEPASTRVLLAGVGSTDTTEVLLHESWHVATLDNDATMLFARSVEWIRERVPAARERSS
ncbi:MULTISPECIES: alpha/beta hydrolase [unclassified Modestobacter]|uniref:alpha/beta hydrolase n=1 Tax=unclassified Modestobacter TaxID=2643866 RepID=UPI0022AB0A43|nr:MULTISPECIES: alpha/beta fold hydrolase [unclassified Modestobacter]MCZ2824776.1 alpha/beta fold hydrolase [Modestobacter sp. VKM Ac-2981]MCZ2854721.1 alpha/beta fold hydrolase [Modestobacter sp. VKM Ac-2982]